MKKEYALKAKKARELALAAAAAEEAAEFAAQNPTATSEVPNEEDASKKKTTKKIFKKKFPSFKKQNTEKLITIEEQIKILESNQATKSQEKFDKTPMTYVESIGSLEGKLALIGKLKASEPKSEEDTIFENSHLNHQQTIHTKNFEFNVKK